MYPTLSLLLSPPSTLKILLEEAIANIDPNKLMNSCSMSTYNHKILERAWQDEILRAVDDCLPKDINIHSEVGKAYCDEGVVDLYIPVYQWAIEVLIDGIGMKEHYTRFQPGNNIFDVIFRCYVIII